MKLILQNVLCLVDGFGGLVVSMLASGTQVCGFKPGLSRRLVCAAPLEMNERTHSGKSTICLKAAVL